MKTMERIQACMPESEKNAGPHLEQAQKTIRQNKATPMFAETPPLAHGRLQAKREGTIGGDLLALQRAVGNRRMQRQLARRGLLRSAVPPRIQRVIDESEFVVQGTFIQINYDAQRVTDDQVRQLLRTLGLPPQRHVALVPAITIGNRPPRGGGSAHSGMPGGPYIRLSHTIFDSSWNRGQWNETLLHEVGHIVDWTYGCMAHMRRENRVGYRALLADPHVGGTQGPGEHFADAYADFYKGNAMSDERRTALLTSRAYQ